MHLTDRTIKNSCILAVYIHKITINNSVSCNNTIGWSLLFLNVKICRSGSHTSADFNKAAIIKYCFNP